MRCCHYSETNMYVCAAQGGDPRHHAETSELKVCPTIPMHLPLFVASMLNACRFEEIPRVVIV